ncbi:MAG TPA: hypothetical protein VFV38_00745 [Ktedonobacteraceae bacterium]|nr:hypothetical protein [Ktedonobacteraceae bacterium]
MKKLGFIVLIGIVSVIVNWLALLVGWWWLTPVIGLLLGLFLHPAGVSFLTSICAGTLGWALPLAILAANAPVTSVAAAVESVVGLSSTGGVAIILAAIALGCILSVTGTWVGITAKKVAASATPGKPSQQMKENKPE